MTSHSPLYKKFKHHATRYILVDLDRKFHYKTDSNSDACENAKRISKELNTTIYIFNLHNDEIFGYYKKGK